MKYVIGIDGGGTKTAFALADASGNILIQTVLPSISYREHGMDKVAIRLREGILYLTNHAGIKPNQVELAAVGVPGYGENAQMDRMLEQTVTDVYPAISKVLVNDAQNAFYGALSCRSGINIVAGTGSIAYGEDDNGGSARSGGWSERFSDEGSCYWLGKMAMGLFCKEADGREPKGALYQILMQALNLKDDFSFIEAVERDVLPIRSHVAQFQKYLLQAAKQGDDAARALYGEACRELTLLAAGVKRQLNFDGNISVSLTGGLIHAGEFVEKPLSRMLAAQGMVYHPCEGSPLEGAVRLACKNVRLREGTQ